MFEFFVALLCGLFFVGRSVYRTFQGVSIKDNRKTPKITEGTVLRSDTFPKTLADGWIMLSEIEDELTEFFGDNWVELFKTTSGGFLSRRQTLYKNPRKKCGERFEGAWNIWVIAYNIWLSKQGYVSDTEYEIVSPEHLGEIRLPDEKKWRFPHLVGEENGHIFLVKMFQMIEENLQKRYPDANLGLWLYYNPFSQHSSSVAPWTIKWSYWFDSQGYVPNQKPWRKWYR